MKRAKCGNQNCARCSYFDLYTDAINKKPCFGISWIDGHSMVMELSFEQFMQILLSYKVDRSTKQTAKNAFPEYVERIEKGE